MDGTDDPAGEMHYPHDFSMPSYSQDAMKKGNFGSLRGRNSMEKSSMSKMVPLEIDKPYEHRNPGIWQKALRFFTSKRFKHCT